MVAVAEAQPIVPAVVLARTRATFVVDMTIAEAAEVPTEAHRDPMPVEIPTARSLQLLVTDNVCPIHALIR